MHQKLFHLVPATLLLLCSACKTPPSTTQEPTKNSAEIFLRENSFSEDRREDLPESLYWDTANVDISDVNADRKLIAFTFDDAPARSLEPIMAVFAAFNESHPDCKSSATVFFNGVRFDAQTPTLLHAACAMGFELGNHTQRHADLTKLSPAEIVREIDETDRLLAAVDGQARHLLRAPFGRVNEEVRLAAYTPIIDWTIDTLDWTGIDADEIYNSVFQQRFSGAIVLMHDGYGHTVSALKRLLPDLYADGYQAVGLSKMIKAHGCRFEKGKVYIRARKVK